MQTRDDGIPSLVIIDAHGNTVTKKGVQDVNACGAAALQRWASAASKLDSKQSSKQTESLSTSDSEQTADSAKAATVTFCRRGERC